MTSSVASEAVSSASGLQFGKSGWFGRTVRAVVRAYQVGRCRSALTQLSDATLKDIGITRSEIDFLAEAMVDGRRDPTRLPPSMWVRG